MVLTPQGPTVPLALVDACRRGDREAFKSLYDAYKDRVYSMALYFFHGDAASAADVTQQVFVKLLTNMHQFRGDAQFSTWLYRMVVNVCLDGARRARTSAQVDPAILDRLPANASHEEEFARRQRAARVQAAISSLTPKIRAAVLLRYFEDLSYAEMASILRCSVGTVASRLNRAHEQLAARLSADRPAHT
jgi:RNA polymerase sigma-70 factor (ECF subfamily)